MSEQRESTAPTTPVHAAPAGTNLRRRGLIAGAAALAAGVLARQSSEPVAAANGAPLVVGNNDDTTNVATATTTLFVTTTAAAGLRVKNSYSGGAGGAVPDTTRDAVQGFATNPNPQTSPITSNSGVHGRNDDLNGIGTTGVASNGTGVYGQSTSGSGVGGSSSGGNGVYGFAAAAGTSQIVAGLFGDSTTTYGIIGRTTASGYSGLTAITGTSGVAALGATSTNANAYAAFFTGTTVVNGNFVAVGGTKSAAVPLNGGHALVYCVESPESWFEDFGEAKLVGGKATVTLDPSFVAIVHSDKYYVYVTAQGDTKGVHVTQHTASGFTVVENQGGTSDVGISYRVVARRADIAGTRLAKFAMPQIKHPDEAKLATGHTAGAGAVAALPKRKP